MRSIRFVAVIGLLFAPLAGQLAAQQPKRFCFQGAPLPECQAFAVFEFTGALRLVGTSHTVLYSNRERDLDEWVGWDAGYMRNRDSVHAIGASFQAGGSGGGTRLALKLRRRTWLTNSLTSDISAGPLVAQQQSADLSGTKIGYGLTAEAAFGAKDLVGIVISADAIHIQDRNAAALHVGGRLGSWATVAASAAALVGVLAVYQAFRND
jgi:hypothetical protein